MNTPRVLTGLLSVQLMLAAFTWWPRDLQTVAPDPLLPVARDEVTRFTIRSKSQPDAPLELTRAGDGWVVSSAHDFPAATDKVESMLDRLLALRVSRPAVTNAEYHGRFNVAEGDATRVVELVAGERTLVAHLGRGARSRVNVRRAGEDAVYEVPGLGVWEVLDTATGYIEPQWLQVDPSTVTRLSIDGPSGGLSLTRDLDGAWIDPGLEPGQTIDGAAIEVLFTNALSLRVRDLVEPLAAPPGAWTVQWATSDGGSSGYTATLRDGSAVVSMPPYAGAVAVAEEDLLEVLATPLASLLAPGP